MDLVSYPVNIGTDIVPNIFKRSEDLVGITGVEVYHCILPHSGQLCRNIRKLLISFNPTACSLLMAVASSISP